MNEREISFTMPIQAPWFKKIKNRKKILEGRGLGGSWSFLRAGMYGHIVCDNEILLVYITHIYTYKTLEEYLITETVQRCLPGVETLSEAINIYATFKIDKEQMKTMNNEEIEEAINEAVIKINESGMQAIYFEIC